MEKRPREQKKLNRLNFRFQFFGVGNFRFQFFGVGNFRFQFFGVGNFQFHFLELEIFDFNFLELEIFDFNFLELEIFNFNFLDFRFRFFEEKLKCTMHQIFLFLRNRFLVGNFRFQFFQIF